MKEEYKYIKLLNFLISKRDANTDGGIEGQSTPIIFTIDELMGRQQFSTTTDELNKMLVKLKDETVEGVIDGIAVEIPLMRDFKINGNQIEIEKCRTKRLASYKDDFAKINKIRLSDKETNNDVGDFFIPNHTDWPDVSITFIDDNTVKIKFLNDESGKIYLRSFIDFGFKNKKNLNPDKGWRLLRQMAGTSVDGKGRLSYNLGDSNKIKLANKVCISKMRNIFFRIFKIGGEPFPSTANSGYVTNFKIFLIDNDLANTGTTTSSRSAVTTQLKNSRSISRDESYLNDEKLESIEEQIAKDHRSQTPNYTYDSGENHGGEEGEF